VAQPCGIGLWRCYLNSSRAVDPPPNCGVRFDRRPVGANLLSEFGIDRAGKARALRGLEGVRLVRVTRASGRAVLVSFLRETSAATVEK
jgi:hypothetical protein